MERRDFETVNAFLELMESAPLEALEALSYAWPEAWNDIARRDEYHSRLTKEGPWVLWSVLNSSQRAYLVVVARNRADGIPQNPTADRRLAEEMVFPKPRRPEPKPSGRPARPYAWKNRQLLLETLILRGTLKRAFRAEFLSNPHVIVREWLTETRLEEALTTLAREERARAPEFAQERGITTAPGAEAEAALDRISDSQWRAFHEAARGLARRVW